MSLLFVVKKQTFSPYFSSNFWLGILLCQLGKRRCFAFGSGAEFRPPKWPEKEHWCRNGLDWLVFYVPVNNFSVMLRRSHFFLGIISTLGRWKCLSQGHYTAVVGFELGASRSRVRRSTTEPPRLHMPKYTSLFTTIIGETERSGAKYFADLPSNWNPACTWKLTYKIWVWLPHQFPRKASFNFHIRKWPLAKVKKWPRPSILTILHYFSWFQVRGWNICEKINSFHFFL